MCPQASNLGQNLAVLRGHKGPVSLIAFHPHLPLALLSASADNSLRLWDASDSHFAPLVLRPGQQTERAGNPNPAAAAAPDRAAAGADQEGAGQAQAAGGPLEPSAMEAAAAAAAAGNAGRGLGAHVGAWEQVDSFAEVGVTGSVGLTRDGIARLCASLQLHALGRGGCLAHTGFGSQIRSSFWSEQTLVCPAMLQDAAAAMLCCAWSPCGTFFAAGNKDCNAYVWHWDVGGAASTPPSCQQQQPGQQVQPAAASAVAGAQQQRQQQQLLLSMDWPDPVPLSTLKGHSKGVWQVEFNNAGTLLASGSTDGSVRVSPCLCSVDFF